MRVTNHCRRRHLAAWLTEIRKSVAVSGCAEPALVEVPRNAVGVDVVAARNLESVGQQAVDGGAGLADCRRSGALIIGVQ